MTIFQPMLQPRPSQKKKSYLYQAVFPELYKSSARIFGEKRSYSIYPGLRCTRVDQWKGYLCKPLLMTECVSISP